MNKVVLTAVDRGVRAVVAHAVERQMEEAAVVVPLLCHLVSSFSPELWALICAIIDTDLSVVNVLA